MQNLQILYVAVSGQIVISAIQSHRTGTPALKATQSNINNKQSKIHLTASQINDKSHKVYLTRKVIRGRFSVYHRRNQ